jgi:hypothetical protein
MPSEGCTRPYQQHFQQEPIPVNKKQISAVALAVSALVTASAALGQEPMPPPIPPANVEPVMPPPPVKEFAPPRIPHTAAPVPDEEIESARSSSPAMGISPMPASGTTLSPPVTVTYSGSSNAVTITDSGTNRGLSSSLTNSNNGNSAVFGTTNGKGAGVKGINSGTTGSAGVFEVTDSTSFQDALVVNNTGQGYAIYAGATGATAIVGESTDAACGTGVEGNGAVYGVLGTTSTGTAVSGLTPEGIGVSGGSASNIGVEGQSTTSYGVLGASDKSVGVYGSSNLYLGVYGSSSSSDGVYANSLTGTGLYANSESGNGITAHSHDSLAIYASSDTYSAIWGQSKNAYAVIGEDSGAGTGVFGSSVSGYAGYFAGKVAAKSYLTLSDRNAKDEIAPVDGSAMLERVSELPITSWTFKGDPELRHVGPMAQDFHAAFGLNGEDDTHINLSDSAGVSLVAIQELNKRLKQKDAQIAALEAQLGAMRGEFSARVARLERLTSGAAETVTEP